MTNIGEYLPTSSTLAVFNLNGNSINTVGSKTSTETNITYVSGKFGQCASFNQTDSVITYADIGTLTTFTISLWINTTSINNCILCQSNQSNNGFFFQINDVGKIDFELWNGGASTHIYSTVPINDGNWHNIIVTRSSATVNIYIDGNFNNQSTTMYTFTIGNYYKTINKKLFYDGNFIGKLDEIIIENIVWSATKVQNYYNVANYKFKFGDFLPTPNTNGLFKLNGNSNNSIGNIASTDSNITYVPGRYGQCASFNGTNSKISYTGSELTNFTISLWIKKTINKNSYLIIQSTSTTNETSLTTSSDGVVKFQLWANTNGSKVVSSTFALDINKWYNIIGTRSGSIIKLYINGQFINMLDTGYTFTVGNYFKTIGSHQSNVDWFNGQMDEIIIENRAWSENEVRKYYTNSLGRFAIL